MVVPINVATSPRLNDLTADTYRQIPIRSQSGVDIVFVRWKKRIVPPKKFLHDGYTIYHAVLVRSQRVNGKPRQKVIRHLGSIKDTKFDAINSRLNFWERVDERLSEMNIDDELRQHVTVSIERTIHRLSQTELEQALQEYREVMRWSS